MTLSEFIKQFDTSTVFLGEHIAIICRLSGPSPWFWVVTLEEALKSTRSDGPEYTRAYRILANDELVELKKIGKPKPWQVTSLYVRGRLQEKELRRAGITHYLSSGGRIKDLYGGETPWTAKDIWPEWEG